MRRLLILAFLAIPLFSQTPTVNILGFHQPSHGSVSVEFTTSGPTPNALRARTSPPGGTCTTGTGGNLEYEGNQGDLTDRKYWPYNDGISSPVIARAMFGGLQPNTTYQLCPEVSSDNGNTYSSGVGIMYTTQSLPAIHPAPPVAPAPVNTTYPDTTGYTTVSPTCSSLAAETNNAVARQLGAGTVLNMPDCDNTSFQFTKAAADSISFQSSSVNVANNTIGNVTYPGGSCGSGGSQVPCLTEGMAIRFFNFDAYHNGWPSFLHDTSDGVNGAVPYVFYLHFPNAGDTNNFQVFYPKPYSQCHSCLWRLGDQGNTNATGLLFVEWPRPASLKAIIFRPATPDAAFAPPGTRIGKQWDPLMFHFRNWSFNSEYAPDGNQKLMLGNIWVVGMHGSFIPDGEVSAKPMTYGSPYGHSGNLISISENAGPIIFDRCWIEGPPFPMRIANAMNFDGANVAMVNGIVDKMYAWHATSTWDPNGILPYPQSGITNTNGGTTFQLGPGQYHGGSFNYVQTGTMHVAISGSPSSGQQGQGLIYVDSSGKAHVAGPPGVTVTTDIGIADATPAPVPPAGDYGCDMNAGITPKNGNGRASVAPIACFFVVPPGTMNGFFGAEVQMSGCDWNGCEGSDTIIAGRGPGPLKFENNYFNWNGNFINFDDCLNGPDCALDTGDYTIRRNYFYHDPNTVRSSPNWNGNLQLHRQGVEWKHGSRDWIIGNIFDGQNGCDNQNPTGTAILGKTPIGDVNDFNVEYNTVMHSCGFSGAGSYLNTNHLLADAMSRIRFANNLIFDDNGWANSSYYGPSVYHGAVGWLFQMNGAVEDFQVVHNTFLDHDGIKPAWIALKDSAEGVQIDNNLFFYAQNPGASGGVIFDSPATDGAGHSGFAACQSLADKALLDCMWPGYTFRGNVIVPGNNSSNIWGTACNNGTSGDACFNRRSMTANAQTSFSAACAAIGGSVAGSVCSGGLPSTVLNYQNGVANAVSSLKFHNPSKTGSADYRLRSDSPIVSGGTYKATDGKDVGADIDALEKAQGKVTLIDGFNVTSTSAVVSFVAPDTQSCPVDYSSTDSTLVNSFTRANDPGTQSGNRSVAISGLSAGTTYYFRVNCATMQPVGIFRTR